MCNSHYILKTPRIVQRSIPFTCSNRRSSNSHRNLCPSQLDLDANNFSAPNLELTMPFKRKRDGEEEEGIIGVDFCAAGPACSFSICSQLYRTEDVFVASLQAQHSAQTKQRSFHEVPGTPSAGSVIRATSTPQQRQERNSNSPRLRRAVPQHYQEIQHRLRPSREELPLWADWPRGFDFSSPACPLACPNSHPVP